MRRITISLTSVVCKTGKDNRRGNGNYLQSETKVPQREEKIDSGKGGHALQTLWSFMKE